MRIVQNYQKWFKKGRGKSRPKMKMNRMNANQSCMLSAHKNTNQYRLHRSLGHISNGRH